MPQTLTIIKYLVALVVVVTLIGLAWWYFFLRAHITQINTENAGRGFGNAAPSFTGAGGSTYANVAKTTSGSSTNSISPGVATATPPALWHVTQTPIAGMGFVVATDTMIYFVERASGNVFSADLKDSVLKRLTNTLMPKIYSASFAKDGSVIERAIGADGKTTAFAGVIVPPPPPKTAEIATTTIGTLSGTYLDEGILTLTVSPQKRELFYLFRDPSGGVAGVSSLWDGSKQKRLFTSALADWRTYWLSDGRIIVAQSPAYNAPGFAYELSGGSLTPLLRNIPGLTILPRTSSKDIVFGEATDNSLALYVQSGSGDPVPLPVKTLADKCVWAPGKLAIVYCAVPQKLGYGDTVGPWLQGRIHTSDVWWKIDTSNASAEILFTSENSSRLSLDVVQPTIDPSGHYLAFMNGVDATLWALRIPEDKIATSTAPH